MVDIGTEVKVSKNPDTQQWINNQKDYLRGIHPDATEEQLTHHARDRVAARLLLERRARELARLKQESETDTLTKVANLTGFEKRIKEEVARMKRTKSKCVLVSLDVNGLKEINDSQGHGAGDQLLINTAKALTRGSRLTDFIARKSGDEFYALLPETNPKGAEIWWERVNLFFKQEGVKISAGATEVDPENVEESIRESDLALYAAKSISNATGNNLMLTRSKQLNT